jgi:hypothetical protein
MNGAAGMEAVGMGGDAAHGMHADRAADEAVMDASGPIGPALPDLDLLVEGRVRQFGGDPLDGRGGHARLLGHRLRRVFRIQVALGHQIKRRPRLAAVRQHELPIAPAPHPPPARWSQHPASGASIAMTLPVAGDQPVAGPPGSITPSVA